MFDYIIIGAGFSGLYANYLLKNDNIIILEADTIVGGRIQQTVFHNTTIQLGAGVLREKDIRLKKLVKKLDLKLINFTNSNDYNIENYSKNWFNTNLNTLKARNNETMLECLKRHFNNDKEKIKTFIDSYGYTDYLKADALLTLKYYPKSDMIHESKKLSVIEGGYYKLIEKLHQYSCGKVKFNSKVKQIELKDNIWIVSTNKEKFITKKVICTIDYNGLSKIVFKPKLKIVDYILNNIGTNNFIRMYTYHDKINVEKSAVVNSFLKQIILINDHVIMSGYSDNKNAIKLKKYLSNTKTTKTTTTKTTKEGLTKLINTSLNPIGHVSTVKDILYKYWKTGTHYFKPGYSYKKDYFYEKNLFVIGEMVAFDQGWTNGAMTSVDHWYNDLIK